MNNYVQFDITPSWTIGENPGSPVLPAKDYKEGYKNGLPYAIVNTQGEKVVVEAAQNFPQADGSIINRTIVDGNGKEKDDIFTSVRPKGSMEWKPLSHEQVADNAWKNLPNVEPFISPQKLRQEEQEKQGIYRSPMRP